MYFIFFFLKSCNFIIIIINEVFSKPKKKKKKKKNKKNLNLFLNFINKNISED